jgi:anti-sigma factor RsiW
MNERPYITCRELIEHLDEYVEQTLSEEANNDVERHLRVCPSCVAYVESYRRTIALAARLREE